MLAPSFVGKELGPVESGDGYRAAGLALFKAGEGEGAGPCVLLGVQIPKGTRVTAGVARAGLVEAVPYAELNFLGGKRDEQDEGAEATAWREFSEETCGALGDAADSVRASVFGRRDGDEKTLMWVRECKYVLYFGNGSGLEPEESLDARFARAVRTLADDTPVEMHCLVWVSVEALLNLTVNLTADLATPQGSADFFGPVPTNNPRAHKVEVDLSSLTLGSSAPPPTAQPATEADDVGAITDALDGIGLDADAGAGLYPPPKKIVLHTVLLHALTEPSTRKFLDGMVEEAYAIIDGPLDP